MSDATKCNGCNEPVGDVVYCNEDYQGMVKYAERYRVAHAALLAHIREKATSAFLAGKDKDAAIYRELLEADPLNGRS